ncbi:MAG: hypothetical protein ACFCUM_11135 [Bacteroidales bacterium]
MYSDVNHVRSQLSTDQQYATAGSLLASQRSSGRRGDITFRSFIQRINNGTTCRSQLRAVVTIQ